MKDQLENPRTPNLSIIVPAKNEAKSVKPLATEIAAEMDRNNMAFELIFIDDGSTDDTQDVLFELAQANTNIRVIQFRRNFGKAAALQVGFQAARGDVIITMDADLQDDPAEIPKLLKKLDEGFDLVSGWKSVRHDPIDKTWPSKVFNRVVGWASGIKLNDFNCGFKVYRAVAVRDLALYGELHRFIPVLLHWDGFRVGEAPVNHRARKFGKSKYGLGRLFKGALDFLGVMLNTRFATRPLHVFGGVGSLFALIGLAALLYLTALWFIGEGPIGNRPLLFFGMLMVMTGLQFITTGLLGEFIQRQGAQPKRRFTIRSLHNFETPSASIDDLLTGLTQVSFRMREVHDKWTLQPSAMTRPNATSPSMPTKTGSTG